MIGNMTPPSELPDAIMPKAKARLLKNQVVSVDLTMLAHTHYVITSNVVNRNFVQKTVKGGSVPWQDRRSCLRQCWIQCLQELTVPVVSVVERPDLP